MRLKIWDGTATETIQLPLPLPAPHIVVSESEVAGRDDIEACLIDVENEAGEIARFWVSVSIVRGRPKVRVATKPDKDKRTQVNKVSTGTFNSISDQDGVLRINDYRMNDARFTTMLFVGPNAAANSKKWNEFVAQLADPSSVNIRTAELLGECFKG